MIKMHENGVREIVKAYNHSRNAYLILHETLKNMGVIKESLELPKLKLSSLVPPSVIVKNVEKIFNCNLKEQRQTNFIMDGRHAAAFLFKKYTILSTNEIVVFLGRKDHTTVLHCEKRAIELMQSDSEYCDKVLKVEDQILNYIRRQSQ